ncbi:MAG: hypothetical protein KF746_01600 [Chitinophagaceae bacterium]|nr:hypothetical protein [Chitinophagaceae bacterium]
MKRAMLLATFFAIAIMIGCRKIEVDGTGNNNGGGNTTGSTVVLSGRITKDVTLKKGDDNMLSGIVYITNGVTLTVEAGATVKGDYKGGNVAALVITRGARIEAKGTQDEPIVFTSSSPDPRSGDWGGIVICGKASINTEFTGTGGGKGIMEVEGGINNAEGDGLAGGGATPDDADNSGTLQYVRIEYAGYAYQPDKEVNSLTMAAVGSGTTIDHVQVTYAKDDAFEWFGGTVNCKYLIAYKTQDDDFDSDNGYSGNVQFGLIVRDSLIADISKSESFESDNNSAGADVAPQTKAVFSNITSVGPLATLSNTGNSNYLAGAQIRRNSSISIINSVFIGWPTGILIDASTGRATDRNITAGTLKIGGVVVAGCKTPVSYTKGSNSDVTGATAESITDWFNTPELKNRIITGADNLYTRPFDYSNPDFVPFGNSSSVLVNKPVSGSNPATVYTYFDDPAIKERSFITEVDFIGAIAPAGENAGWHKGWTRFNNN